MSSGEDPSATTVSSREALVGAIALITAATARDTVLLEKLAGELVKRNSPAQMAVQLLALADLARLYVDKYAQTQGTTGAVALQALALTIDQATNPG